MFLKKLATQTASRRDFFRQITMAAGACGVTQWFPSLALAAERPRKSVVLLWLNGGPATIDLWDCKPGNKNGGPVREIKTATPGLRISEYLPQLSRWTQDMVLIRSMSSREGDHARAAHLVRTGYVPQAAIDFPDLGALVAHEMATAEAKLPSFVSIAPPARGTFRGAGFLGPQAAPLAIGGAEDLNETLRVPYLTLPDRISETQHAHRQELLRQLDAGFQAEHDDPIVENFRTAGRRALRLMHPEIARTFEIANESEKTRERYGQNAFGQGCLMARRLIERQVPFVEVTLDGWDTHQDNFNRVRTLAGQLDTAFAALLSDLSERGLLESTLIVCLGEFGRTPKINDSIGRDHWPNSWAVALAGGGIQGGQAIGQTNTDGTVVESRPYHVPDLIATICQAVGIDPRKQNDSNVGRPIRIADPDAITIEGVL